MFNVLCEIFPSAEISHPTRAATLEHEHAGISELGMILFFMYVSTAHTSQASTRSERTFRVYTLALRFLMSPEHILEPLVYTVRPYVHWYMYQHTHDAAFRKVNFSDVTPRARGRFTLEEGDYLKLQPPAAETTRPLASLAVSGELGGVLCPTSDSTRRRGDAAAVGRGRRAGVPRSSFLDAAMNAIALV
jgi:hypothetical protein